MVLSLAAHHRIADGQATTSSLGGMGARHTSATRGRGGAAAPRPRPRNPVHATGPTARRVPETEYKTPLLASRASSGLLPSRRGWGYTTFENLLVHLWRAVTAARELGTGETTTTSTTTRIRITVNGRVCIRPPVPRDYFGNLVL
uniref:Uncharacterized protein n=1 Tax=Oryza meridionalis TaxID=40149 RepID=A0A0E0DP36_9ORYZ